MSWTHPESTIHKDRTSDARLFNCRVVHGREYQCLLTNYYAATGLAPRPAGRFTTQELPTGRRDMVSSTTAGTFALPCHHPLTALAGLYGCGFYLQSHRFTVTFILKRLFHRCCITTSKGYPVYASAPEGVSGSHPASHTPGGRTVPRCYTMH